MTMIHLALISIQKLHANEKVSLTTRPTNNTNRPRPPLTSPIPRPRTGRENGRFPHEPLRLDAPPHDTLGLLLGPRLLLGLEHRLR